MKIKKIITYIILMGILCSNNIFAFDNHQKIQHVDNDIYKGIRDLYLSQSLGLPSAAAPYSDAELIMMLDLLDTRKFSKADQAVYNYITESLSIDDKNSNEYGKVDWGVDLNLEGYVHSETTDFLRRENFQYNFLDQKPLINIGVEAWNNSNFYGLGNFSIGNNYSLKNTFGSTIFSTNVIALPPNDIQDLDMNMPYRAFIAFGNESSSLSIGRDRVRWGNGVASNLLIGDNLPYLDQLRYTNFSNQFKYTFLTAFFPHPSNYINDGINGSGDGDPTTGLGQSSEVQGTYALIAHRGEGRLFNDKLTLALSETIMYSSLDNVLDLRYLSPTAIFHDYYIRGNANSMLSLEADYTAFKNFNIYGQMVVDEFALPGEPAPGSTSSNAYPNAFGYLAGIRYHYDVLDVYKGNTSLEFAFTDPYLYLRGNGDTSTSTSQEVGDYGINYIVAFREFSPNVDGGTWYHNEFLGYKYGGDAITFNLNSSIKNYGKWNIQANIFYMLHGTFDKYTTWKSISTSDDESTYTTPTTDHPGTNNENNNNTSLSSREPTSDPDDRNAVSKTLVIGASANYEVNENLSCFMQVDYINIKNYQNVSGQKTSDVQLVLSLSYSI